MDFIVRGYERNVLLREDATEIVHFVWHPGARTPKHDHGGSHGWVLVLKGRVFEIVDGKKTYHETGATFHELSDSAPHIVGNDTPDEAVTVHIYRHPEGRQTLDMHCFDDNAADLAALNA